MLNLNHQQWTGLDVGRNAHSYGGLDWIGLDWVSNLVDSVGLKNGPMDISVLDPIQPNPQTH